MDEENINPYKIEEGDSEIRKKIKQVCEENELQSILETRSRSRALHVGQSCGGTIEFAMRNEWSHLFYIANPVEAIEIMGSIAAACGVEIAMRPRNDFSSWRSWDTSLPSSVHWMGAAPWQLKEEDRKELGEAKKRENSSTNKFPEIIEDSFKTKQLPTESDQSDDTVKSEEC